MNLTAHLANVHSQNGEDGVLSKLFDTLGISEGYFVEFGAWDGKYLSNTFALFERGWRGCYIEGDEGRFRDLCSNISDSRVSMVCRFVAPTGWSSLDAILDEAKAPKRLDLLSIDIDSDDLAIWRSVRSYRATCVVIEYNPTIPFDCEFENVPGRSWGNSALSICKFAASSGYSLVCVTTTNLIFVDRTVVGGSLVDDIELSTEVHGPRWFWGYDGTLLCKKSPGRGAAEAEREIYGVPWAGTVGIQPIPRVLRGYHGDDSLLSLTRQVLGVIVAICLRPVSSIRRLRHRNALK